MSGTCDPATGLCSTSPRPDGTPCDDANACTRSDTCQMGVCMGADPVVCPPADQCHEAGTCDPVTGTCSRPAKPDGTACNDGNSCTQNDTCQAGVCTGGAAITCAAMDQCHDAGVCDPATGMCSNPMKADGASCDDGNACTHGDTCHAGACMGGTATTCTAMDQCHDAGVCDPATGMCSNPAKVDGASCSDGNACTQGDVCRAGVCTGGAPVTCAPADQCHGAGVCSPATGSCTSPTMPDGTACDDGDSCTQSDTCRAGVCTGSNPVVCVAPDACHSASCDKHGGKCHYDLIMPESYCKKPSKK
jgi:hypothetical protein